MIPDEIHTVPLGLIWFAIWVEESSFDSWEMNRRNRFTDSCHAGTVEGAD